MGADLAPTSKAALRLISAVRVTQIRHRFIKSCDGVHVRLEEERPRLGLGRRATLAGRAFGMDVVCA
jgi:hypothetical protein